MTPTVCHSDYPLHNNRILNVCFNWQNRNKTAVQLLFSDTWETNRKDKGPVGATALISDPMLEMASNNNLQDSLISGLWTSGDPRLKLNQQLIIVRLLI